MKNATRYGRDALALYFPSARGCLRSSYASHPSALALFFLQREIAWGAPSLSPINWYLVLQYLWYEGEQEVLSDAQSPGLSYVQYQYPTKNIARQEWISDGFGRRTPVAQKTLKNLSARNCYEQRCQETVRPVKGKRQAVSQECQIDRSTLKPGNLPSVKVNYWKLPSVKGSKSRLLTSQAVQKYLLLLLLLLLLSWLTLVKHLESVVTQRCWSHRKIRKTKWNQNSSGKYHAFPPKTHDTK